MLHVKKHNLLVCSGFCLPSESYCPCLAFFAVMTSKALSTVNKGSRDFFQFSSPSFLKLNVLQTFQFDRLLCHSPKQRAADGQNEIMA